MTAEHTQAGRAGPRAADLVMAFERDELGVHFQPKVDVRSGRVVGMEALARWDHPTLGLLSADDFIDLVDASGRMRALTQRVIEIAAQAAGDWWRSGLALRLSVNLAPSLFFDPDWRLDELIDATLREAGLPGEAIQVDVVEDTLMTGADLVTETLTRLSRLGATISVDDFGTGHFSFRQLMTLPIEELKIDRSIIRGLAEREDDDKTIVRSIIHLAHQMGLQVVAEGVETEEAWRQLRSMGAERAQGFLISKPIPAREVPAWLATWNQRARELSSTKRMKRATRLRHQVAATSGRPA